MPQTSRLLDAFAGLNVLVIGDVMIDRYLRGTVDRISPEAPVPVVRMRDYQDRLGGAANVALNIKALGATPYLCSVVGRDQNAAIFKGLLPQHGLSDRCILQDPERVTTVKTRVIAQNQQLLRVDQEDTHDLSEAMQEWVLAGVRELLDSTDIHLILFQDYNKGVLTEKLIGEVIAEAIRRNIPTAVDPKYRNFWSYKNVTLFKPNLREIQDQLDFIVTAEIEVLKRAAAYIRGKLDNPYTLITLSDKGLFVDHAGQGHLIPTHPRSIADVCGAGDTVISTAALALAAGLDAEGIGILANLAGGQVCEKVGVVPVDLAQLKAEVILLQNGRLAPSPKAAKKKRKI